MFESCVFGSCVLEVVSFGMVPRNCWKLPQNLKVFQRNEYPNTFLIGRKEIGAKTKEIGAFACPKETSENLKWAVRKKLRKF
jgi:hypothetical protein